MEHTIKKVKAENGIIKVIDDDNIKRKIIPLNFLHNYFASADGRVWKKKEITKNTGKIWREVMAVSSTAKHRSKQVFIRDKKGKHRRISRAFLVLCAYRGYAGVWFYAAHLKDRTDDSLRNLRWRFRKSCTKRNKRKNISPSFFDIFKDNPDMMSKYLCRLRKIDSTAEARDWNEAMLKRYENSMNGGKRFEI